MTNNFHLGLLEENGKMLVDFANNTGHFVEVVLDIDGQEVRGFCYPPFHHKPIRRLRSGESLPFSRSGRMRAYVYTGIGKYIDDTDYGVPPFIIRKLNNGIFDYSTTKRKVTFRRTSSQPVQVLEIPY